MLNRRASNWVPMLAKPAMLGAMLINAAAIAGTTQPSPPLWTLQARLVASGLPGAHGLRQVGRFHAGGPFASNPEFMMKTQAGRVLDPQRLLVAVDGEGGMLLSIDPRAEGLVVPHVVSTQRGPVGAPLQVYSARSARLNGDLNPGAITAAEPAVASPRYVSVNNAFGRPWIANAPKGLRGEGTESVTDPDGAPLAHAPSDAAGGVFAGARTPRTSVARAVRTGWFASLFNRRDSGQLTPGDLDGGAFGTAFLGASPDGSGFAVFAVVTGRGAVVQIHVQDGVDGLAAPGTIGMGNTDPGVVGIAFKWNPGRALFIADARRDRIAVLNLGDDTRHFVVQRTVYIDSPWLQQPVDLAPATPEIANPRFASHTTLAGGSDLYVANQGDGTLLRMAQDGRVLARSRIQRPDGSVLQAGELRSLAVSADGQRLWVIDRRTGRADDELLALTAFDAEGVFEADTPALSTAPAEPLDASDGQRLFATTFSAGSGLGPRFNAAACIACHPGVTGVSSSEAHFARRIARLDERTGRLLPLGGQNSAVAARRSAQSELPLPVPRPVNVVSLRMPLSLVAASRIDQVDEAAIEAQAVAKGDGIHGRVHRIAQADGSSRIGRYGWKADVATLDAMVAQAFSTEMGLSSPLAPQGHAPFRDDGTMVRAVAAYLRTVSPTPEPTTVRLAAREASR